MDDLDNLRRITDHILMMREELAEEVARPMAIDKSRTLDRDVFVARAWKIINARQPKDYSE